MQAIAQPYGQRQPALAGLLTNEGVAEAPDNRREPSWDGGATSHKASATSERLRVGVNPRRKKLPLGQVIAVFGAVVIAFDLARSLVTQAGNYNYSSLFWVSSIIYAVAGATARRHGGISAAAVAGGCVAAIEATIGWWLSTVIGPGSPSQGTTIVILATTVAFVVASGAALGALGGLVRPAITR